MWNLQKPLFRRGDLSYRLIFAGGNTMSDLDPVPSPTRRPGKAKTYTNGSADPSQELLQALQAMRSGDFSVRMSGDRLGIEGKIADTFNEIIAANERMAQQLERVGQVV